MVLHSEVKENDGDYAEDCADDESDDELHGNQKVGVNEFAQDGGDSRNSAVRR